MLVSLEELPESPLKAWKRPLWPESWVSIDRPVAVSSLPQKVEKPDLRALRIGMHEAEQLSSLDLLDWVPLGDLSCSFSSSRGRDQDRDSCVAGQ